MDRENKIKFEYYQDIEGNAYELKTDLEQLLVHDIFEQDKEIDNLLGSDK